MCTSCERWSSSAQSISDPKPSRSMKRKVNGCGVSKRIKYHDQPWDRPGGELGQNGVQGCSAVQGTFFHLHQSPVGRVAKNTKTEKSVPRRVPFLKISGKWTNTKDMEFRRYLKLERALECTTRK